MYHNMLTTTNWCYKIKWHISKGKFSSYMLAWFQTIKCWGRTWLGSWTSSAGGMSVQVDKFPEQARVVFISQHQWHSVCRGFVTGDCLSSHISRHHCPAPNVPLSFLWCKFPARAHGEENPFLTHKSPTGTSLESKVRSSSQEGELVGWIRGRMGGSTHTQTLGYDKQPEDYQVVLASLSLSLTFFVSFFFFPRPP